LVVRKEDSYYTEQVGYLVNPVRFSLVLYMDALVVVMNDLETLWYVGALGWSAWLEKRSFSPAIP
jgi:hypothetical protein